MKRHARTQEAGRKLGVQVQVLAVQICDGVGFAEQRGLLYYGPDTRVYYPRGAVYVDRILRGANPAELPVEQPQRFETVINMKTAQRLGLGVPRSVLVRAERVIE